MTRHEKIVTTHEQDIRDLCTMIHASPNREHHIEELQKEGILPLDYTGDDRRHHDKI